MRRDLKELKERIIKTMAAYGSGRQADGQPAVRKLTGAETADKLLDFTNWMEGVFMHTVISTAIIIAECEQHGSAKPGSTRAFLDRVVPDFEENLTRKVRIGITANLFPIDPYAEKTHNEKLADEILRNLECEGNGKPN